MRRKTFILALTFNFVSLVIICVIFTLCISLWNKKRQGVTTPSWEGMGCMESSLQGPKSWIFIVLGTFRMSHQTFLQGIIRNTHAKRYKCNIAFVIPINWDENFKCFPWYQMRVLLLICIFGGQLRIKPHAIGLCERCALKFHSAFSPFLYWGFFLDCTGSYGIVSLWHFWGILGYASTFICLFPDIEEGQPQILKSQSNFFVMFAENVRKFCGCF